MKGGTGPLLHQTRAGYPAVLTHILPCGEVKLNRTSRLSLRPADHGTHIGGDVRVGNPNRTPDLDPY
jgi:hypothetical protein